MKLKRIETRIETQNNRIETQNNWIETQNNRIETWIETRIEKDLQIKKGYKSPNRNRK